MSFNFPPAPVFKGLTYIGVRPVCFADHRTGQCIVFPVYGYADNETGELVLVSEDRYEPILDKLMAKGAFGPKGGRA